MKKLALIILLVAFFLAGCEVPQSPEPTVSVFSADKVALHTPQQKFLVEVARTNEERMRGLMFREKLEKGHGMIFVFEEESLHAFWMKNTLIPLDMVWINADGVVVDKTTAVPCPPETQSCPVYTPENPGKYVLEVNAGEFQEDIGDVVELKL